MARILIYDVNPSRLQVFQSALLGHEVLAATDHNTASQLATGRKPDLILSDWDESWGNELLYRLEKVHGYRLPPFYFMQTISNPDQARGLKRVALKQGASGFIPLPIGLADFLLKVNEALYRAGKFCQVPDKPEVDESERQQLTARIVPIIPLRPDGDSPFSAIAHLVGGIQILDEIIDRHRLRDSDCDIESFRHWLSVWGGLDSQASQIIHAVTLIDELRGNAETPAEQAMLDLAAEVLFGAEVYRISYDNLPWRGSRAA